MKIMTIQIPDDSVDFVEEFVERIGGSVGEKNTDKKPVQKSVQNPKKKIGKTKKEKIDHTYLFGKWKDFDIDARKLREQAW